jgi:hypothetical protein
MKIEDVEVYVYASIEDTAANRQHTFLLPAKDRTDSRDKLNALDDFKRTLSEENQEHFNIHVWGGYEIKMLRASDIQFRPVESVDRIINFAQNVFGLLED